jgi:hypothetical protein
MIPADLEILRFSKGSLQSNFPHDWRNIPIALIDLFGRTDGASLRYRLLTTPDIFPCWGGSSRVDLLRDDLCKPLG